MSTTPNDPIRVSAREERARLAGARLAAGGLLAIEDVAALLGTSSKTVRRRVAEGRLPPPDHRDGARILRWRAATVRKVLGIEAPPSTSAGSLSPQHRPRGGTGGGTR